LARGHTGGSKKKDLEPTLFSPPPRTHCPNMSTSDLFFPSKYGNFCAFMHWIILLAAVQNFTQKMTLVETNQPKQGVCQTVALPFTLKSILMKKKNYGNSNI
jgi:hypothetical protein